MDFKSLRELGGVDAMSDCSAERHMSSTISNVSVELCELKDGKCTKMSLISFCLSAIVALGIACVDGKKFSESLFRQKPTCTTLQF